MTECTYSPPVYCRRKENPFEGDDTTFKKGGGS